MFEPEGVPFVRIRSPFAPALLGAAALALGCGGEPQLDVETAAAQPAPASAPVQPAHAPIAASVPTPSLPATALPEGHPPLDAGAPAALPPVDPSAGRGASALVWSAPASWIAEPPANPMRRAQYRVGGPGGDGECVVFYFGPGQGGAPIENARRWASQFAQPGGGDPLAAMKTRAGEVAGTPVLWVETTGTYDPRTSLGSPGEPKPEWALLGAIVKGPDANWFVKFTGPEATVAAERASFERFVGSLRSGG
jgi:hypothetical protein